MSRAGEERGFLNTVNLIRSHLRGPFSGPPRVPAAFISTRNTAASHTGSCNTLLNAHYTDISVPSLSKHENRNLKRLSDMSKATGQEWSGSVPSPSPGLGS